MSRTVEPSRSRAVIKQHPERSVPDEANAILARGIVAHVGFAQGEQPFVIPFGYHFSPAQPDRLYLHGGTSSRALQHLRDGAPVCVTVTLLDGLVYSRTALYHSMNYRSVVCFGRARVVQDVERKRALFEAMTLRYYPGRTAGRDYDRSADAHLEATTMLEIAIEEKSAKTRRGGPLGPRDREVGAPGTCGVVELPRVELEADGV